MPSSVKQKAKSSKKQIHEVVGRLWNVKPKNRVCPFFEEGVGRRTGAILNKNIRKDIDGFEIFDDYWTDSDQSDDFDEMSFKSVHKSKKNNTHLSEKEIGNRSQAVRKDSVQPMSPFSPDNISTDESLLMSNKETTNENSFKIRQRSIGEKDKNQQELSRTNNKMLKQLKKQTVSSLTNPSLTSNMVKESLIHLTPEAEGIDTSSLSTNKEDKRKLLSFSSTSNVSHLTPGLVDSSNTISLCKTKRKGRTPRKTLLNTTSDSMYTLSAPTESRRSKKIIQGTSLPLLSFSGQRSQLEKTSSLPKENNNSNILPESDHNENINRIATKKKQLGRPRKSTTTLSPLDVSTYTNDNTSTNEVPILPSNLGPTSEISEEEGKKDELSTFSSSRKVRRKPKLLIIDIDLQKNKELAETKTHEIKKDSERDHNQEKIGKDISGPSSQEVLSVSLPSKIPKKRGRPSKSLQGGEVKEIYSVPPHKQKRLLSTAGSQNLNSTESHISKHSLLESNKEHNNSVGYFKKRVTRSMGEEMEDSIQVLIELSKVTGSKKRTPLKSRQEAIPKEIGSSKIFNDCDSEKLKLQNLGTKEQNTLEESVMATPVKDSDTITPATTPLEDKSLSSNQRQLRAGTKKLISSHETMGKSPLIGKSQIRTSSNTQFDGNNIKPSKNVSIQMKLATRQHKMTRNSAKATATLFSPRRSGRNLVTRQNEEEQITQDTIGNRRGCSLSAPIQQIIQGEAYTLDREEVLDQELNELATTVASRSQEPLTPESSDADDGGCDKQELIDFNDQDQSIKQLPIEHLDKKMHKRKKALPIDSGNFSKGTCSSTKSNKITTLCCKKTNSKAKKTHQDNSSRRRKRKASDHFSSESAASTSRAFSTTSSEYSDSQNDYYAEAGTEDEESDTIDASHSQFSMISNLTPRSILKGGKTYIPRKDHSKASPSWKMEDEDTETTRRSKRHRMKPLEYWRNERPIYEKRKSGGFLISGVNPGQIADMPGFNHLQKNCLIRRVRKPKPDTPRNLSVHTELPIEFEEAINPKISVVNPLTKEETDIDAIFSRDSFVYHGPSGKPATEEDSLIISKVIKQNAFAAGHLILRPLQEKGTQYIRSNTMVFHISKGKLAVTIHNTTHILESGDMFFVPQGNTYSLKNLREEDAKLVFFQHKG